MLIRGWVDCVACCSTLWPGIGTGERFAIGTTRPAALETIGAAGVIPCWTASAGVEGIDAADGAGAIDAAAVTGNVTPPDDQAANWPSPPSIVTWTAWSSRVMMYLCAPSSSITTRTTPALYWA
jgi:hypothetical protein